MKIDVTQLLVLDIETVAQYPNFDQVPPELQHHWKKKSRFLKTEEEADPETLYEERSAIYSEFGKVIVIALGIYHYLEGGHLALRVTSFQDHDEKKMLHDFIQFLTEKYTQRAPQLCAHNGKEFDFPYLCRRMLVNELPIPAVLDQAGKKPWEVSHLDTMELWKFGDRKNFTSLDLLTTIFGIPSSKSDIDGSQVNQVYYQEEEGLKRIARYCRGDVIATAQLLLKFNQQPLIPPENITIVD
jgi:hypothetical protein